MSAKIYNINSSRKPSESRGNLLNYKEELICEYACLESKQARLESKQARLQKRMNEIEAELKSISDLLKVVIK